MQRYGDVDRDSGVRSFEIGSDFIRVEFYDNDVYLYTYRSAGRNRIEQMKRRALAGDGLNAYINSNVKRDYQRKER